MPKLCKNGLHLKRLKGLCKACLSAKNKRRYDDPAYQDRVNRAHANWRKNNPGRYDAAQKDYWSREDVKKWNRERMRLYRAGLKSDPASIAARAVAKAAAATEKRKQQAPDPYGIIRKERPL
jgi:hypothetical protein